MNNFLRSGRGMLFFENQFLSNPLTIRTLSLTIIFCVLFSIPDLLGARAYVQFPQCRDKGFITYVSDGQLFDFYQKADTSKRNVLNLDRAIKVRHNKSLQESVARRRPDYDSVRFPVLEYEIDRLNLGYMNVGESIPDEILDMPLWIVNDSLGRDITTLRELSTTEYLVLDTWANMCAPCIVSMNRWEDRKQEIKEKITVVGVHMGYDYQAIEEVKKRGWSSAQITGKESYILSRYLCGDYVMGPSAWIKDGRLFGVSNSGNYDIDFVGQLLRDEIQEIPDYARFKLVINQ